MLQLLGMAYARQENNICAIGLACVKNKCIEPGIGDDCSNDGSKGICAAGLYAKTDGNGCKCEPESTEVTASCQPAYAHHRSPCPAISIHQIRVLLALCASRSEGRVMLPVPLRALEKMVWRQAPLFSNGREGDVGSHPATCKWPLFLKRGPDDATGECYRASDVTCATSAECKPNGTVISPDLYGLCDICDMASSHCAAVIFQRENAIFYQMIVRIHTETLCKPEEAQIVTLAQRAHSCFQCRLVMPFIVASFNQCSPTEQCPDLFQLVLVVSSSEVF